MATPKKILFLIHFVIKFVGDLDVCTRVGWIFFNDDGRRCGGAVSSRVVTNSYARVFTSLSILKRSLDFISFFIFFSILFCFVILSSLLGCCITLMTNRVYAKTCIRWLHALESLVCCDRRELQRGKECITFDCLKFFGHFIFFYLTTL